MIPSKERLRRFSRPPWGYRVLSWVVGGFCGALVCLLLVAGLVLVPVPFALALVALPLGLVYGFAWGWLLMRRAARRSGIRLQDNVLERAPVWQWHLGLLLGVPLSWLLTLIALTILVQPGEATSLTPVPPPPTPNALPAEASATSLTTVFVTLMALGAFVGRSTVALWGLAINPRRTLQGLLPRQRGVWS